jgi:hypothetical protein
VVRRDGLAPWRVATASGPFYAYVKDAAALDLTAGRPRHGQDGVTRSSAPFLVSAAEGRP